MKIVFFTIMGIVHFGVYNPHSLGEGRAEEVSEAFRAVQVLACPYEVAPDQAGHPFGHQLQKSHDDQLGLEDERLRQLFSWSGRDDLPHVQTTIVA